MVAAIELWIVMAEMTVLVSVVKPDVIWLLKPIACPTGCARAHKARGLPLLVVR